MSEVAQWNHCNQCADKGCQNYNSPWSACDDFIPRQKPEPKKIEPLSSFVGELAIINKINEIIARLNNENESRTRKI
jgi:hypothetical protein